ncbi:hypothetical protein L226DRAFT_609627 [Lentinus tigrinus ALCF2SS1-7]|uniref:Protein CPL1-like domain-containing protein n=1 Tax=Lentinus tigrinus ALCF2SS1-6 TaxID=1328759 RepID=A0A5C2SPE3_9APHY|nr:hypothetical protein L227DRAFT_214267 [Lentinus tigrinus ALCF2SS1-6]RPD79080.1 hypothetical protein L226DRAFT_609627 [Lentinus tigrinus ALCF2SS1-7]
MLAVHALLAFGYFSGGAALALTTPPLRPLRSKLPEARAESQSSHVGYGLRPRHPLTDDTCFYANATTLSDITFSGLSSRSASTDFADTDTCICLSGLSATLSSLSSTASLIDEFGLPGVEEVFSTYIASSSFAKACTYPPNSRPQCTRDNLCGFSCDPPFIASGDSCVCQNSSDCGPSPPPPATCQASGKTGRLSKRSTISTLAIAQSACGVHETVCGTFDGTTANFRCVDIQTSLDSCGGCILPSPFGLRANDRATAVDCTAIPSVDAVSCMSGKCIIQSCLPGWTVDAEGTGCIREQSAVPQAQYISQAPLDKRTRRSLALQSHPNGTSSQGVKPHSNWRIPDYRSEPEGDYVDRASNDDGAAMRLKEDWTRIPDIRRQV